MTINDLTPQELMLLTLFRLSDALPAPRSEPNPDRDADMREKFDGMNEE